jgi:CheY-like chemotaxis protein
LIDLEQMIQSVLELLSPLVQASKVDVRCRVPDSLPQVVAQLTAVRQAFLNIIAAAIDYAVGKRVSIRAWADDSQVHVNVRSEGSNHDRWTGKEERFEMAQQLIELSGGSLELSPGDELGQPFAVRIVLPSEERVPVLVIDDNADTLRLLERYLSNSRYHFVGTSDPEQALQLAAEWYPQIIVLDVMLPAIDGWELLGRLNEHPQTRKIPIIVCTILPQEQLALSLGAAAFIRKPVKRRSFLSRLDRQLGLAVKEPH